MNVYERLIRKLGPTPIGGQLFVHVFSRIDRKLMGWSRGRLSIGWGTAFEKSVLLLITTGARSGKSRSTPLVYARHGDELILIASRGGTGRKPDWFHNLSRHPEVEVLLDGRRERRHARVVEGPSRDLLWQKATDVYAGYNDYQTQCDYAIPVVALSPVSGR